MQTDVLEPQNAIAELQALAALIRRPPLDDVQLEQDLALRIAAAIDVVTRTTAQPDRTTSGAGEGGCTMGVGCDEAGVCYAAAHGDPGQCPKVDVSLGSERLARAKERQAARDASGEVHVDGSIYEGIEASLQRGGRTIAHVARYADAVEIAAALSAPAQPDREAMRESVARVERVETVPLLHPFDDTETPPIWRVVVGGHCADFDHEQAACNFCAAINNAILAKVTPAAGDGALREALFGIDDDYMTSEAHHPGYVLIPTAKFEQLREAARLALGAGGGE